MPLPPSTEYLDSVLPRVAASTSGAVLANALRLRSRTGRRLLAILAHPEDRDASDALDHTAFDRRVKSSSLHLRAYCDLAYALAAQPLDDGDQAAALSMYGRARRLLGSSVPERDQTAHVRLAGLHGDRPLLESLRRTYNRVPEVYWKAAECAVRRTEAPGDEARWFAALLDFAGWEGVALAPSGPDPLGRLRPDGVRAVEDGPLVSVAMTCFRPGPELLTAVRSVLSQSWRHLELLLVDDASGPEYADVLLEAAGLDDRVQLIRQRVNGGTYRARNRALGMARGEMVTGLDSDDWAHPRWIEHQIAPLLERPELVMSVAEGIRCSGGLEPAITPELRLTETRSTSVMYRAAEVREHTGFYDTVLKSADTEFKLRIQRHFGSGRTAFLRGRYLTVVRHRSGSLSEAEVAAEWVSPARAAYESAFRHWHKQMRQGRSKPFLAASAPERPFPAPRELLERGVVPDRFDLVTAADWRRIDRSRRGLLDAAAEAAGDGGAVGLVHYPAWDALQGPAQIAPEVLAFAAEHGLLFADLERSGTDRLIASDDALLFCLEQDYGVTGTSDEETRPTSRPHAALRVRVERLPSARGLAAACGAGAAVLVGAGAAVAAAGPAAALTAAATGVAAAAAIGAIGAALAARRLRR
ncbi:glycosyltransferase family 2 protein [Glycomyces sp. NPDC047010]|uniref:glycosyltransferase family 2 protein n=1 Tax=Glycomyces sp. NPDC047010 TaxID=3155023 RepID=UPI0033DF66C6